MLFSFCVILFFCLFIVYILRNIDIKEYAIKIGIDPDKESNLISIAEEGLNSPLPDNWKPWFVYIAFLIFHFFSQSIFSQGEEGKVYYFNVKTKETLFYNPCEDIFKEKVKVERNKLLAGFKII